MDEKEDTLASPMHFITIRIDDYGIPVLDLGDFNLHEALGILTLAVREVKDRCPDMEVRYYGEAVDVAPWMEEEEE